jgi:glycosyltransferase involved in cell wall biosynthesis
MVSICCLAYNQEAYIRDTLDGFLKQKTDFPFEILIHDDASTDHTADIIREYEAKYPDIVKPVYQKENQWYKGISISFTYNFSRAKGKYIALCEGDDFWTDPLKLQKQFDFMESHPDYALCCSDASKLIEESGVAYTNKLSPVSRELTYRELNGDAHIITATAFFRKDCVFEYYKVRPQLKKNRRWMMGDLPLALYMATHSKVFYLSESLACYRIRKKSEAHGNSGYLIRFYRSAAHIKLAFNAAYNNADPEMRTFILNDFILKCFKCLQTKGNLDLKSLDHFYRMYKRINGKTRSCGRLSVMYFLSKYFPWWISAKDCMRSFAIKYVLSAR